MNFRLVLFDLGGVVLGSPLHVISEYEALEGIKPGSINRVIGETGLSGSWSRLECGGITMKQFFSDFEEECKEAGFRVSSYDLMKRISDVTKPRSEMLEAIRRIRKSNLQVAALTNNWKNDREGTGAIKDYFDFFFESSELGMRKPDPRIYEMACTELKIDPRSCAYLDDLGINCKPAANLGMMAIKVIDPEKALDDLEEAVGFSLR